MQKGKITLRLLLALLMLAAVVLGLAACGEDSAADAPAAVSAGDVAIDIDVTEAGYVASINEIYANYKSYLGKVVRIQGMVACDDYTESGGGVYHYVYRTGPGCCGNDGAMCGFEFTFEQYPPVGEWVEVIGRLDSYVEDGTTYLTLDASKVEVKAERGLEVVSQ